MYIHSTDEEEEEEEEEEVNKIFTQSLTLPLTRVM